MAYTDSGLGWYANSDWMTNQAGTIGELGVDSPAGMWQLQNNVAGGYGANVVVGGDDWLFIRPFWGDNNKYYVGLNGGYIATAFAYGDRQVVTVAQIQGCTMGGRYDPQYVVDNNIPVSDTYDSTTGLYYHVSDCSWFTINEYNIPHYTTFAEGMQAAKAFFGSQSEPVTYAKSSTGYSVTCMCKWKEELGGDVFISPVLISTVNSATFWTVNGNTPIQQLTEHSYQGQSFYMRLYKLHEYDPDETLTANFPVMDYSESLPLNANNLFLLLAVASELGAGPVPEDDPYAGAGESGPDAGDPTFDFTSEDIPVPSIPSIGAYNTGFINMYKPTAGDLRDLAHYLWSGSFDPDNLRKLIANPMDAILGLHIVPTTASHPAGSAATLYVGNIDTQLSMARLTEQYYELDCGTINIEPKWGAYLDYAPYSKLTLYLPYIGFVPISPDDCMGGSISVKYHVDVLSGACCVYVYCTSNRGEDSHVLYSYTGACACDCPVTEGQYTNAILGILNIAGSVAGAISGALTGNAGGITGGIESAANAALSMVKPDISRSGSFGGSAGLMGIQYPYLVLTVPRMCTPGDQQKQEGYPSFVTKAMGQLAGYNQVQVKRMVDMSCTEKELDEIISLLEGGVIF